MLCQWYARCPNPADGVVEHPILPAVPTCKRCADLHGSTLLPLPHLTREQRNAVDPEVYRAADAVCRHETYAPCDVCLSAAVLASL